MALTYPLDTRIKQPLLNRRNRVDPNYGLSYDDEAVEPFRPQVANLSSNLRLGTSAKDSQYFVPERNRDYDARMAAGSSPAPAPAPAPALVSRARTPPLSELVSNRNKVGTRSPLVGSAYKTKLDQLMTNMQQLRDFPVQTLNPAYDAKTSTKPFWDWLGDFSSGLMEAGAPRQKGDSRAPAGPMEGLSRGFKAAKLGKAERREVALADRARKYKELGAESILLKNAMGSEADLLTSRAALQKSINDSTTDLQRNVYSSLPANATASDFSGAMADYLEKNPNKFRDYLADMGIDENHPQYKERMQAGWDKLTNISDSDFEGMAKMIAAATYKQETGVSQANVERWNKQLEMGGKSADLIETISAARAMIYGGMASGGGIPNVVGLQSFFKTLDIDAQNFLNNFLNITDIGSLHKSELFTALSNKFAIKELATKAMGYNPSNKDLAIIVKSLPYLGFQPETNVALLNQMEAKHRGLALLGEKAYTSIQSVSPENQKAAMDDEIKHYSDKLKSVMQRRPDIRQKLFRTIIAAQKNNPREFDAIAAGKGPGTLESKKLRRMINIYNYIRQSEKQ